MKQINSNHNKTVLESGNKSLSKSVISAAAMKLENNNKSYHIPVAAKIFGKRTNFSICLLSDSEFLCRTRKKENKKYKRHIFIASK